MERLPPCPQQNSRRMTLPADDFIRRFLIHTLPPGFQRIRHFGFLANRFRKEKLALFRQLLATPAAELLPNAAQCLLLLAVLATPPPAAFPECGVGVLLRTSILPAYLWPAKPPNTSSCAGAHLATSHALPFRHSRVDASNT